MFLVFMIVFLVGFTISACSREDNRAAEEQQKPGPTETVPGAPQPGSPTPAAPGEPQDSDPLELEEPDQHIEPETPGESAQQAAPFWTSELRQAVAAAIDREAIVDRVFEGNAVSAYHTIPPNYQISSDPFFRRYGTRDLSLSTELLTDAGYTENNPLIVNLWAPLEPRLEVGESVLNIIQEQLEDTGLIRVNLHAQDRDEYLRLIETGEIPLFTQSWLPNFAHPDNWLSPFASCALSKDLGIHYCSSVMDEMLHLAAASTGDQRTRIYEEIGDLFANDPPVLPLLWGHEPLVYREGLQGIVLGSTLELDYSFLQFDANVEPTAESRDTVVIGTTERFENQDPFRPSNLLERDISKNTGLPLMRLHPEANELAPGAAADFPIINQNGTEYTFHLREGLRYSDGTPVSSRDYIRSWEYLRELEDEWADIYLRYVEDVLAPDDRTLVFHLTGTNTFFPVLAASPLFLPLHPDYTGPDWHNLENTATGPFRLTSYRSGERIELEANPEYRGDVRPAVQMIIIQYYPDAATLSTAVANGEIDIAWRNLTPGETVRLQDQEGLRVEMVNTNILYYLAFNHRYLPQMNEGLETEE